MAKSKKERIMIAFMWDGWFIEVERDKYPGRSNRHIDVSRHSRDRMRRYMKAHGFRLAE